MNGTSNPRVLYRSDTLIAVDKPQGIIVHGDGTGAPTLTDAVRELLLAEVADAAQSAARDLQCLQRLDHDTSGIVLFSLSKQTQGAYDRLIAEHAVEKHYRALVKGRFPKAPQTYTWPIGRDRHDARKMRVSRTGKTATTHACRLGQYASTALLDVRIETGRKHQIRVHLSHACHPIVGDELYGHPHPKGLMLHAAELSFRDPVTDEFIAIRSSLPRRFRAAALRTDASN